MRTPESLAHIIDVAMRRIPADLVLRHVRLLDVITGELRTADIAIVGERIAAIGLGYAGVKEIDCKGLTAVPGFIDTHCHIESSLVTPYEYERCVLPHGVTTAVCDPHELANVCGTAALDFFRESARGMVMHLEVHASSCVPALPSEEAGATLTAADLLPYADQGLSEMMNIPGLLGKDPDVLAKLSQFSDRGIDGHAPLLSGDALQATVAAGIINDHECTTAEEALDKLRLGQTIFMRYGSVGRNVPALLPLLKGDFAGHLCFCTDDRDPLDVLEGGHIDGAIRLALDAGCDPLAVYRAASLSAAEHFGWRDRGRLTPGAFADIVLLSDFGHCTIRTVVARGKEVTDAAFNARPPQPSTEAFRHTIKCDEPSALSLADAPLPGPAIGVQEGSLLTEARQAEAGDITACLIARHGKSKRIGRTWIHGTGITQGALASSVGHDSHNLCVMGATAAARARAAAAVRTLGGGFVVANDDQVLAQLALPLGGLLSEDSFESVTEQLKALRQAARATGATAENPFLTLAFLPLPVIPFARLTLDGYLELKI